jgi:NTE family protein
MKNEKPTIECLAVFEGGGAKGIAFAGALEAAEEQGIKFSGYGGASSGAIIALLSCFGYKGSEIKSKLKRDKIINLLDKKFLILFYWVRFMSRINYFLSLTFLRKKIPYANCCIGLLFFIPKVFSFVICYLNPISIFTCFFTLITIGVQKGIFKTDKLVETLREYAFDKVYLEVSNSEDRKEKIRSLTFLELEKITGVKLKVIATDILTGTAVELSSITTPDELVFESVAASSSYPIFFRPSIIKNQILTDGGISCNLPSFLFNPHEFNRLPVYAFDLRTRFFMREDAGKIKISIFLKKLTMSMIDASNNIISDVTGGIIVPVIVSPRFGTFSFNLSDEQLDKIFNQGKVSAKRFMKRDFFTSSMLPAKEYHMYASLIYGNVDYLLKLIQNEIEILIEDVKLQINLYTDITTNQSRIVAFSHSNNFNCKAEYNSYDLVDSDAVCVNAWNNKQIFYSYDESNNRTKIFYPIERSNRFDANYNGLNNKMLALLELEFQAHYLDISFFEDNTIGGAKSIKEVDFSEDSATIIDGYCFVIRNSMLGHQAIFHESKNTHH